MSPYNQQNEKDTAALALTSKVL